jgi:hypothetical protein
LLSARIFCCAATAPVAAAIIVARRELRKKTGARFLEISLESRTTFCAHSLTRAATKRALIPYIVFQQKGVDTI